MGGSCCPPGASLGDQLLRFLPSGAPAHTASASIPTMPSIPRSFPLSALHP